MSDSENAISISESQLKSMTKERREAFELLSPSAQRVALKVQDCVRVGYTAAVLVQYDMGIAICDILDDEEMTSAEKKTELKKLASFINQPKFNASALIDIANTSATFDRDFIKDQISRPMANGRFLTWTHFRELQRVESEKARTKYLEDVRKNCWSCSQLALELSADKDTAETSNITGRTPDIPKTPKSAVKKLQNVLVKANNYIETLQETLTSDYMKLKAEDVDDKLIDIVSETAQEIEDAKDNLKEMLSYLEKFAKHCSSVAGSSYIDAEHTAADSDDTEDEDISDVSEEEIEDEEAFETVVSAKASKVSKSKRPRVDDDEYDDDEDDDDEYEDD